MFRTVPDWNKLSKKFELVSVPMTLDYDVGYILKTEAECVQLRIEWLRLESAFQLSKYKKWRPISCEWARLPKCDKLEILFDEPNDRELTDMHINLFEEIHHRNMHVVLGKPIQVRDGYPKRIIKCPKYSMRDDECHEDFWLKDDVEYFSRRLAMSSVKTLTCSLEEESDKKITFECYEDFPSKFMEFLDTQPIYRGNDWESYLTLNEAKKSFRKKSKYQY